jgi:S1-C subfamily serine protease
MRLGWVLAALLVGPVALVGQAPGMLRITVSLVDADRAAVPVPRHVLLISDNPSSSPPKRIVTRADGTIEVALRPGNYTVESDRPVVMSGRAYQWTHTLDVAGGRDTLLALTAANADAVEAPAGVPPTDAAPNEAPPSIDLSLRVRKWQQSLVGVWSPTARASGFVVDARGLIATDGAAIGTAGTVEVQVSPAVKITGRVLRSDAARGVAIVLVDPASLASHTPVPVTCPPAASSLDEKQAIAALTSPYAASVDTVEGEVTTLGARAVDTDLRLRFGGAGGPVFNAAGEMIGLTSTRTIEDQRQRRTEIVVTVLRSAIICDALAAARESLKTAAAPGADRLPIEPGAVPRRGAVEPYKPGSAPTPPVLSASDFDVALISPPMVEYAAQKAGWTGGSVGRSAETEARLGRLMEFGDWSEYFMDRPRVLIVRVSPKLVEGFWKRLAREAARTQGAQLPPFKDFAASFLKLDASCESGPIAPVHPFVIEHKLSDTKRIREGLYVFDPAAFRQCESLTLSLYEEKEPQRPSTLKISGMTLAQVLRDF